MSETKTTDIYLYLDMEWPFDGDVRAFTFDYEDDPTKVFLKKIGAVEVRIPDQAELASAKIANLESENRKMQAETQRRIDANLEQIRQLQALEYK